MRVFNVPSVATFTLLWLLYSSPVVASVGHQGHDAARRHRPSPNDQRGFPRGTGGYVSAGYFTNLGEYSFVRITAASVLSAFFLLLSPDIYAKNFRMLINYYCTR